MLLWFFLFLLFLLIDLGGLQPFLVSCLFLLAFQIAFSLPEQVYILSRGGLVCLVAEILIVFFSPVALLKIALLCWAMLSVFLDSSGLFSQMDVGFFQRFFFLCPVIYILWWSTYIIIKSISYCMLWHMCYWKSELSLLLLFISSLAHSSLNNLFTFFSVYASEII